MQIPSWAILWGFFHATSSGSITKGVFGQKMSHCRLLRGEGMKLWESGGDYPKLKIPL